MYSLNTWLNLFIFAIKHNNEKLLNNSIKTSKYTGKMLIYKKKKTFLFELHIIYLVGSE